ncbi:MAG: hypothetical protein ACD_39C00544G0001 [uncultured bacterium]|nr:MAG: hypothetical protein ACD_39C00544G0001 [uncultured bacterium]
MVFAVTLLAFFIYFIANSFVSTKKQHHMNSEYLTRAYIADVVVKLVKERIEVNPNFLAGINNIGNNKKLDKNSCLVNPIANDINYNQLLNQPDYNVELLDIPVISYADADKKAGFYFGIIAFKPENDLFSGSENGFKTFLNINELEKYAYDLKISNDAQAKPVGFVKIIEVTVRYKGLNKPDQSPFTLTTKIICPVSSMSSATYEEIQKNLFKEIAGDIYASIEADLARGGFSLSALVAGIERDCKASTFNTMKIVDLGMPENAPDRPRAEAAFKQILVLHCALELYQEAISELNSEQAQLGDEDDVVSTVKVMDNSVQKAQWALQVLEVVVDPIDDILVTLQPSGIAPPNPDAMFNYQVPIMAMRYLLSASEKDRDSTRVSRFIAIVESLPEEYSQSMQEAFTRVNRLLQSDYRKLTPRQLQKYSKSMLSFYQLASVNSSRLTTSGVRRTTDELAQQASATLSLLNNFYSGNNYLAGVEFVECEKQKLQQFNSFSATRLKEIIKKVQKFNTLADKLKRLKEEVNKIDAVARGEQEVKLVEAPYEVNMNELSSIYLARGRQAVEEYLNRCRLEYEASLMRDR